MEYGGYGGTRNGGFVGVGREMWCGGGGLARYEGFILRVAATALNRPITDIITVTPATLNRPITDITPVTLTS